MEIGVIGGGTFGTALANSLKKENKIYIYTRNESVIQNINLTRINKDYFPNKVLSKQIKATNDLKQIQNVDIIFLCIPSHAIINFINDLKPNIKTLIVNGAKGFGSGIKLIPEAIAELVPNQIASFKGPSFANELIFDLPTAFTFASSMKDQFRYIKKIFREDLIVLDYTTDIRGVEYLSIIKNIYAIVIGIIDAIYNSANVRFLIYTKSLNEINRLAKILGINEETIFNYSGIGDFSLTALNDLSRNRTLGLLIGKGFLNNNISSQVVLEGMNSINKLIEIISNYEVTKFPILMNLSNLLNGNIDVKNFVNFTIYQTNNC